MTSRGIIPDRLTERIIAAGIEVHRHLGPGLLESTYEECMVIQLTESGLNTVRQQCFPIIYKGKTLSTVYRLDLIVDNRTVIEIKSVDTLAPVHTAQVLTYLRVSGLRTGLLLNFNTAVLKDGVKRISL
jgi:GxxExxY protein